MMLQFANYVFSIDVCIKQCMYLWQLNIYVYIYIICSLMDKFMPLLFIYQLNSFSTGHKYLLQRNSLPVAIKLGVYHVQMISGSIVLTKWVCFSCSSRNLMVNYADIMRKNCIKEVYDIHKELSSIFLMRGQPF